MIRGFADSAADLTSDRAALQKMSEESANYARTFTWKAKAEFTVTIYEWVLGRRSERPEFLY
jgi:hypothetical protein